MDTQTLQRLRTELEAASTLHLALGRIAQRAQPTAPTAWTGPSLEELEELAADDGSFSHASMADLRRRSGAALVAQFHSLMAALAKAPEDARDGLRALLSAVLVTGTQDASLPASPSVPGVLSSLARSAGLQLEATMRAAMLARDGLPVSASPAPAPAPKTKPKGGRPPRVSKRAPKRPTSQKKAPARRKPKAATSAPGRATPKSAVRSKTSKSKPKGPGRKPSKPRR
ncbi:MAG: hypothetical protein INH41_05835 [Myxococcaceae bacterium]|nr:hypothetical protein [Myxococcaceae bacterium]